MKNPEIGILDNVIFFTKAENKEAKQVLSGGGGYHCKGGRYKERGSEGKYGGYILYTCTYMEK
jgi:hypothetical protein